MMDAEQIVPSTDLRGRQRRICIITTACLPWMTGKVTLLVPWLERKDQDRTYPHNIRFEHPNEQKQFVRDWLIQEANLPAAGRMLDIRFYSGRYHDDFHSIFPMGDIAELIPDEEADICVLEEPEHLNWYRAPFKTKTWTEKFKHVVGIIHTNYLVYARSESGGFIKEPFLQLINQGMCRAYCHRIIKLSDALQNFAPDKEITSNVHGVRENFLQVGDYSTYRGFTKGAYFVGKLAWPKGLDALFKLMNNIRLRSGRVFEIDIYGNGPHASEIEEMAKNFNLPTKFLGAEDHAILTEYKVFVNPSVSEVLCTTIVEALAMGKWVVCAKHPSNDFFEEFPNCLTFRDQEEFAANVLWALNNDPIPLSVEHRYKLSWDAATERLISSSAMTQSMFKGSITFSDKFSHWLHDVATAGNHGDVVRNIAGGKAVASQTEFIREFGSSDPIDQEKYKRRQRCE